jgi:WD40 repeat protein
MFPPRTTDHTFLAFSPSGKKLAVGRHEGGAELWDLSAATPMGNRIALREDGVPVWPTVTFADENTIVCVRTRPEDEDFNSEIVRWDLAADAPLSRRELPYVEFDCKFVLSGNGQWLFVDPDEWDEPRIEIWDTGRGLLFSKVELSDRLLTVRASHDGRTFAFCVRGEGEVQVWDREQARVTTRVPGFFGPDWLLSPDGRSIATCSGDGIALVDLESNERTHFAAGDGNEYCPLHFSADGTAVVAVAQTDLYRRKYMRWNLQSGDREALPLKSMYLTAYSPQGDTVATYSRPDVSLWRGSARGMETLPNLNRGWLPDPCVLVSAIVCVGGLALPMGIVCLVLLLNPPPARNGLSLNPSTPNSTAEFGREN